MGRDTFYEVGYNGHIIRCAYAEEYCQEANNLRAQLSAEQARVEELEEEQRVGNERISEHIKILELQKATLRNENQRLREGLKFYADEDNWHLSSHYVGHCVFIIEGHKNGWDIARSLLAGREEGE